MRHRRVQSTAGVVDGRSLSGRRLLVRAGILFFTLWICWAFAQEAWTANRLAAQASELRQRNSALQSQNADYRRDIATVRSGAAAEEVARSNGYSKPDEKVYVVSQPAGAAPPAAPTVRVQQASPSFVSAVQSWWTGLLHRRG
jgi:cell division protein FtsB